MRAELSAVPDMGFDKCLQLDLLLIGMPSEEEWVLAHEPVGLYFLYVTKIRQHSAELKKIELPLLVFT